MGGFVENLAHGTQVLAHGVDLAQEQVEELHVLTLIGEEVPGLDIAGLAVAVQAAIALLDAGRVPRNIPMQQVAGGPLKVETFAGRIRGNQDADGIGRVVEGLLDVQAGGSLHAAVEEADGLRRVFLPQAGNQGIQGGFVFRENDQTLIGFPCVAFAQVGVDQMGQGGEAAVLFGSDCFHQTVAGQLQVERRERRINGLDFGLQGLGVRAQPGSHGGGGSGQAAFGFGVVGQILLGGTLGGGDFRFGGRLRLLEAFHRTAPAFGKGDRAGQQAFAQDLDGESPGALGLLGSLGHQFGQMGAQILKGAVQGFFGR